jgi:hypothetical protein
MVKNIMNSSDDKYKGNGSNYDQELETIIRINLNERLAEEMKKNGIDCKAVEVNSLSIEQKPYFSNNFAMSSKFITNRGCIRINYRNIDIVQIIEKLDIPIYIVNILYIIYYICMDTHKLLRRI